MHFIFILKGSEVFKKNMEVKNVCTKQNLDIGTKPQVALCPVEDVHPEVIRENFLFAMRMSSRRGLLIFAEEEN